MFHKDGNEILSNIKQWMLQVFHTLSYAFWNLELFSKNSVLVVNNFYILRESP
jgi:hypothetical protein